jgi:hypothetical protein
MMTREARHSDARLMRSACRKTLIPEQNLTTVVVRSLCRSVSRNRRGALEAAEHEVKLRLTRTE